MKHYLILFIFAATFMTKSTPETNYKYMIFPDDCYDRVTNMDFDMDCGKKILSKGLSLGIVTMSFIYKVP